MSKEERAAFLNSKFGKSKKKVSDSGKQSPEVSSSPKKQMTKHAFSEKVTKKDM